MTDDCDIYIQCGGTPDAANILARYGVLSGVVAWIRDERSAPLALVAAAILTPDDLSLPAETP